MLYDLHELSRTFLTPASAWARSTARVFSDPGSWFAQLPGAAEMAAGYELLHRVGKRYEKPAFGIDEVDAGGARVRVAEETLLVRPFCKLRRFRRHGGDPAVMARLAAEPAVLIVAPLSGHFATLLRDTVRTMLRDHDVYVTDWSDARVVPLSEGPFSLTDYVHYLTDFIRHVGTERLHVMAVCQATVPAVAAVSLMAARGEAQPRSLVLMGGPVDARRSPTAVNQLATSRSLRWFETNLLHRVPGAYPGRGRLVYPGFLQYASFVAMNPLRHMMSHWDFFQHLVRGDLDSTEAHRRFYDEYNAVMDLSGEYYLDCIRIVFQQHLLPRGEWHVDGQRVAPEAITAALLTIEGELDDISGAGQTAAAHELCRGVPADRKRHLPVVGAGHYGIFSGRRWREMVYPEVAAFIAAAGRGS